MDPQNEINFGSSEAASLGGKARAERLTPERRSEIASAAVRERWKRAAKAAGVIPRATHPGVLRFEFNGTETVLEIPCAVLEDGTRVLSQRGVTTALSNSATTIGGSHYQRKRDTDGDAQLPPFLSALSLKPFIPNDLSAALVQPIEYLPEHGGRSAYGLEATLIPQVCDVWLKARAARALNKRQQRTADKAELIIRGLARVGIIALIDAATGYEDVRPKGALAKILEEFVTKELAQWVRTYPTSFFRELCRLRDIPFREDMRLPRYFGHLVNDLVYARLAPGVLDELKRRDPILENGRRAGTHTQWITQDRGHPKLLYHLGRLEGIAEDFADGQYAAFRRRVDEKFKKYTPVPLFEDFIDENGNFIGAE